MSGWEIRMSGSRGVLYFYYSEIRQSAWDLPADVSEAAVKTLPGHAEHIAGDGDKHTQVHRHILLVKHVGSLRPSSWKEPMITRSVHEAVEILIGY